MSASFHKFGSYLFSILFSRISTFFLLLFFLTQAHSLSFNFTHFEPDPIIRYANDSSTVNGVIQLTANAIDRSIKGSVGRVSYSKPVRLWDKSTNMTANFTTHFQFMITQLGHDPMYYIYGDGITFFLTPFDNSTAYAPNNSFGGCLGLVSCKRNSSSSVSDRPFVAIEFDTFNNDEWDPYFVGSQHLGIDVTSVKSEAYIPWSGGVQNETIANAWITYDSHTKNLSVYLTYDSHPKFNGESNLSHVIDLSSILPEKVRVGFSSATGTSTELHYIHSWYFNSTLEDTDSSIPQSSNNPQITPPPIETRQRKIDAAWVGGVVAGIGVLTIVLALVVFMWQQRRSRQSREDLKSVDDNFDQETWPKRFTYYELSRATNNFSEEGKLGQGGFGCVYEGFLTNLNREIAVKKISSGSVQGKKEYMSEVKVISRLRHKNLVQLLGWCHEGENLLLVYEFMLNGSLDSHLYLGKRDAILPWAVRYKIAQELASVLLYLHQDWEQCVLHRDIKSSNVMLDSNFNAKLGDFGLARLVDHQVGSQTTALAGTLGYLAPECVIAGKASKESDVYSFGVVALEIACGRRPVEPKEEPNKVGMVEWVWNLYGKGHLLDAIDKRLQGEFDMQQVQNLLMVGLWCSHPDDTSRPSIRQAINVLNFESPLPSLPVKFPALVFCSSQMNINTSYATPSSSSSGMTGSSGTTSCSSHSAVPETASLLPDDVNV